MYKIVREPPAICVFVCVKTDISGTLCLTSVVLLFAIISFVLPIMGLAYFLR